MLIVEDSYFEDTDANVSGGALDVFESEVTIRRTEISNFSKGAVHGSSMYSLELD